MAEMFNAATLERKPEDVAAELKRNGYVVLREALTRGFVDQVNQEIGDLRPDWNVNSVNPVLFKNSRVFTHCLARSRSVFDLIVRSWCFQVLKAHFGSHFRLTDQRVYVTEKNEHMQWHVDNKFDSTVQHEYPGVIFIFYLCDVEDGELQIIRGSNEWSKREKADFTNDYIEKNYASDILSLKMPAGSGLLYDTTVVHRAHPIRRSGWERKSLFFQVERKETGGDPILLNTAFAADLDPDQQYLLGFGAEPEYMAFPPSSVQTMRPSHLLSTIRKLAGYLPRSTVASAFWGMPPDVRWKFKRLAPARAGAESEGN